VAELEYAAGYLRGHDDHHELQGCHRRPLGEGLHARVDWDGCKAHEVQVGMKWLTVQGKKAAPAGRQTLLQQGGMRVQLRLSLVGIRDRRGMLNLLGLTGTALLRREGTTNCHWARAERTAHLGTKMLLT
jgi:hypothetical protein